MGYWCEWGIARNGRPVILIGGVARIDEGKRLGALANRLGLLDPR
jgi:hypothetical protein